MKNILSMLPNSWRRSIQNAIASTFDSASNNPQRTSTLHFPFNSVQEIRPHERRELVKKHRSLRNNLGCVRGMINTTVTLAIGPSGIQPIFKSGDPDFDRRAQAYWKRATRTQTFDVSGMDTEVAMQRLVLREMIVDGEIFGIKVFDGFGKPQRQLIKTEEVASPSNAPSGENWVDGIQQNTLRRPLNYSVIQSPVGGLYGQAGGQSFKSVKPRDMLHVFDRERAHQHRGLPWGYTGLNHGVDIIDIGAFEKVAHKLNSAIVGSMTTADGKPAASMDALMAAAMAAQNGNKGDTKVAKDTKQGARYLDLHGTMIPIFKAGENMQFFNSRNSINTTEFAGWLFAQYAQGFGMPVEWVVGLATGSAAVRGNNELGGRFIEGVKQIMIDDWCQPNGENIIGTAILAHSYPKDYPLIEPLAPPRGWTGWNNIVWRGAKNITVDRMRDGKLALELIRAGLMTREEWWTLNAEDPSEMDDSSVQEIATERQKWLDAGLPEEMFWRRIFGQNLPANANTDAPPEPQPPAN